MTVEKQLTKTKAVTQYELCLNRATRKANGVYYTPENIINYILEHTLEQADVKVNPFIKVFDPACGCGLFLLAAYDILKRKFTESLSLLSTQNAVKQYELIIEGVKLVVTGEQYWRAENIHQHLLRHCLFGADSDASAIELAAKALSAKSPGDPSAANLIVCDSLIKWEEGCQCSQEAQFWRNTFDYIIGNPPYIPVTRIKPEQKAYYRNRYQTAQGRFNSFVLFLERAIDKASVKIGMIVPSRLLLNTQYTEIRRLILQRANIERIYEAREGVFAGANVDTVVVILTVGNPHKQGSIVFERYTNGQAKLELVDPALMTAQPGGVISFAAGTGELAAISALEKCSVQLGDIADIRDGIIQGAVGPELFLGSEPRGGSSCKPVLTGQMIEAYACNWRGEYIWYDPPWLTELETCRTAGRGRGLRLRTPEIFERPKILSRQTADHIIAAMDTQGYYYMNTLHGITVINSAFDPWYVLAVMNSELIRCWYAWRFAETGRSFAQVKIANLKLLPVPSLELSLQMQIAQLSFDASRARQEGQCSALLLENINDILYNHCGLDTEMINAMRNFAEKIDQPKIRRRTIRR